MTMTELDWIENLPEAGTIVEHAARARALREELRRVAAQAEAEASAGWTPEEISRAKRETTRVEPVIGWEDAHGRLWSRRGLLTRNERRPVVAYAVQGGETGGIVDGLFRTREGAEKALAALR